MFHFNPQTKYQRTTWSKNFLAHCRALISHPSYSPDLALAKYLIFSKENTNVKGRKFQDIKDIKNVVDDCFVKILDRCKKCFAVKRDYCGVKYFSSYFMYVCSYKLSPGTSLFDTVYFINIALFLSQTIRAATMPEGLHYIL